MPGGEQHYPKDAGKLISRNEPKVGIFLELQESVGGREFGTEKRRIFL